MARSGGEVVPRGDPIFPLARRRPPVSPRGANSGGRRPGGAARAPSPGGRGSRALLPTRATGEKAPATRPRGSDGGLIYTSEAGKSSYVGSYLPDKDDWQRQGQELLRCLDRGDADKAQPHSRLFTSTYVRNCKTRWRLPLGTSGPAREFDITSREASGGFSARSLDSIILSPSAEAVELNSPLRKLLYRSTT